MSLITRTNANMDVNQCEQLLAGNVYAGEALDIAAPCYIKSSDGKVYMSNGTNADEAAEFAGFTPRAYVIGETVTLFGAGTRFRYGSSLTPGDVYYIAATKGRLDSAATTGDTSGTVQAVSSTDVVVRRVSPTNLTATADGSITGTKVSTVAAANVIGGVHMVHQFDLAAGALADSDIVLTHKSRVINAWLVLRGAGVASTTITVKNSTNAISDTMAASGSDKAVVRCATLDDAYWEVAAGGTLRVTSATGATQPAATVYVEVIRVP